MIFSALAALVGSTNDPDAAAGIARVLGLTASPSPSSCSSFRIPYIVCGWGLLKLRPWARILGIILAAICLIRIPFGTIFGIYALIILFKKETEALFAEAVRPSSFAIRALRRRRPIRSRAFGAKLNV